MLIQGPMGTSTPRLVVIGSLNVDLVLQVGRLPEAGATETAQSYRQLPGGKGANQAVAAARLGAAVCMIGSVGEDRAGDLLLTTLGEAGVATESVARSPEPTGTAVVLVTPAGENSILVAPGANGTLSPTHVRTHAGLLRGAGMILTQLETPADVLDAALVLAEEAGVPLMLDPAPATALPSSVLGRLAWFTPNLSEARFYAPAESHPSTEQREARPGERRPAIALRSHADGPISGAWEHPREAHGAEASAAPDPAAARALCLRLQALGPANILLKLGKAGAGALTRGGAWYFEPAPSVAVVDSTGAGDVLNAAFAAALLGGADVAGALRYAVAAASLSVTRSGAMASAPARAEVEGLLDRAPG